MINLQGNCVLDVSLKRKEREESEGKKEKALLKSLGLGKM